MQVFAIPNEELGERYQEETKELWRMRLRVEKLERGHELQRRMVVAIFGGMCTVGAGAMLITIHCFCPPEILAIVGVSILAVTGKHISTAARVFDDKKTNR